jgi:hypothetical protein
MSLFVNLMLSLLLASVCQATDDAVTEDFDVKPGGVTHIASIERDGISCEFIYACQGGTNEKWRISVLQIKEKGHYGCIVERKGDSPSYIFFQKFKLTASSNTDVHNGEAFGREGEPLRPHEYKVDKAGHSIEHVEEKFGSQLTRVTLEFTKLDASPKADL